MHGVFKDLGTQGLGCTLAGLTGAGAASEKLLLVSTIESDRHSGRMLAAVRSTLSQAGSKN